MCHELNPTHMMCGEQKKHSNSYPTPTLYNLGTNGLPKDGMLRRRGKKKKTFKHFLGLKTNEMAV